MNILETKEITKRFDGNLALNRVSLTFEKGKITGIMGINGSGKTTLLDTMTGILPFDEGTVFIDFIAIDKINTLDVPVYRVSSHAENLGSVELKEIHAFDLLTFGISRSFQSIRVFEQLSVLDNVLVVLSSRNLFDSIFKEQPNQHLSKAKEILTFSGLWEKKDKLACHLSFSERKLLEFCRLVLIDVGIILLDEPFNGLSNDIIDPIINYLIKLKVEGKTLVITDNNIDRIKKLCDYVYVMAAGQVLAHGQPDSEEVNQCMDRVYFGKTL